MVCLENHIEENHIEDEHLMPMSNNDSEISSSEEQNANHNKAG